MSRVSPLTNLCIIFSSVQSTELRNDLEQLRPNVTTVLSHLEGVHMYAALVFCSHT